MSKAFPSEVLSVPEQCARIIDALIEKRKALGLTQKELDILGVLHAGE